MNEKLEQIQLRIADLQAQQAVNAFAVIDALNVIMHYNMRAERIAELEQVLRLLQGGKSTDG